MVSPATKKVAQKAAILGALAERSAMAKAAGQRAPMAGGAPPPPPMGGDPMGGMGGGMPPMGGAPGAPPPGGDMGAPPAADIPSAGAESEKDAKKTNLEEQVPDDLKESIKQQVKEKVQEKIQEITGKTPAEVPEEGAAPEGGEMPPAEGGEVPPAEAAPTEITGENIEEFPSVIDRLSNEQLEELFNKAADMVMGKESGEGGEEKAEKKTSEEKLDEFADLEPPEDLTMVAGTKKGIIKKAEVRKKTRALVPSEREKICTHEHAPYRGEIPNTGPKKCSMCGMLFGSDEELKEARDEAKRAIEASDFSGVIKVASDIIVGHMETDGQYYVSCPNASIKAMIGIPRVHPIVQCQNCPHYGDNGDNSGGSMAQIFCGYTIDSANAGPPVRYIPLNTEKPVDTTLPFGNLIKEPDEDKSKGKKKTAQKIPIKKIAKKDSEYFAETNKMDDVFLKKNDMGEMVIEGTTYKLKRVGTDVEIYEGSKLIDTIKGGINYNDQIVRDTEFMARMNKNPNMQTKMDNRRAFYDDLFRFRKYASEGKMSSRQAFRTIIRESSYDSEYKASEFKTILEDNGYDIVLTHEDKNWIRRAVRANSNNMTRLATRQDIKVRSSENWDDNLFDGLNTDMD